MRAAFYILLSEQMQIYLLLTNGIINELVQKGKFYVRDIVQKHCRNSFLIFGCNGTTDAYYFSWKMFVESIYEWKNITTKVSILQMANQHGEFVNFKWHIHFHISVKKIKGVKNFLFISLVYLIVSAVNYI